MDPEKFSQQKIIICADDFGMSEGINHGIIKLLEAKRITAVTCLVTGRAWAHGADLLGSPDFDVDIGLHLSFPKHSFKTILKLAYLRQISKDEILTEFQNQLKEFRTRMDSYPDFVDGHQHIHQLPVFNQALIELMGSFSEKKVYVRNTAVSISNIFARRKAILKNLSISFPGYSLKKLLLKNRIPTNSDFLGIYDYNNGSKFENIFKDFLKNLKGDNSVFMIHPAETAHHAGDPIANERVKEMEYLMSPAFDGILRSNNLHLSRFLNNESKN